MLILVQHPKAWKVEQISLLEIKFKRDLKVFSNDIITADVNFNQFKNRQDAKLHGTTCLQIRNCKCHVYRGEVNVVQVHI